MGGECRDGEGFKGSKTKAAVTTQPHITQGRREGEREGKYEMREEGTVGDCEGGRDEEM